MNNNVNHNSKYIPARSDGVHLFSCIENWDFMNFLMKYAYITNREKTVIMHRMQEIK
jgi:hypothetical protein